MKMSKLICLDCWNRKRFHVPGTSTGSCSFYASTDRYFNNGSDEEYEDETYEYEYEDEETEDFNQDGPITCMDCDSDHVLVYDTPLSEALDEDQYNAYKEDMDAKLNGGV